MANNLPTLEEIETEFSKQLKLMDDRLLIYLFSKMGREITNRGLLLPSEELLKRGLIKKS